MVRQGMCQAVLPRSWKSRTGRCTCAGSGTHPLSFPGRMCDGASRQAIGENAGEEGYSTYRGLRNCSIRGRTTCVVSTGRQRQRHLCSACIAMRSTAEIGERSLNVVRQAVPGIKDEAIAFPWLVIRLDAFDLGP